MRLKILDKLKWLFLTGFSLSINAMEMEVIDLEDPSSNSTLVFTKLLQETEKEENDDYIGNKENEKAHPLRLVFDLLMQYAWDHRKEDNHTFYQLRQLVPFYKSSLKIGIIHDERKTTIGDFLYEKSRLSLDSIVERESKMNCCEARDEKAVLKSNLSLVWALSPYNENYPSQNSLKKHVKQFITDYRKSPLIFDTMVEFAKEKKIDLTTETTVSRIVNHEKRLRREENIPNLTRVAKELFLLGGNLFGIIVGARLPELLDFTLRDGHLKLGTAYDSYFKLPLSNMIFWNNTENDRWDIRWGTNLTEFNRLYDDRQPFVNTHGIPPESAWNIVQNFDSYNSLTGPRTAIIALSSVALVTQVASLIHDWSAWCNEASTYDQERNLANKYLEDIPEKGINELDSKIINFIEHSLRVYPSSSQLNNMVNEILKEKDQLAVLRGSSRAISIFCNMAAVYQYTLTCLWHGTFKKVKKHIASASWTEPYCSFPLRLYVALNHDLPTKILYTGTYLAGLATTFFGFKSANLTHDVKWGKAIEITRYKPFSFAPCPQNSTIERYLPGNYNGTAALFKGRNYPLSQTTEACAKYLDLNTYSGVIHQAEEIYKVPYGNMPSLAFGLGVMNLAVLVCSFVYSILFWCA